MNICRNSRLSQLPQRPLLLPLPMERLTPTGTLLQTPTDRSRMTEGMTREPGLQPLMTDSETDMHM